MHGFVHNKYETALKNESSRKPIPMEHGLARLLLDWRTQCAYPMPDDYVFASMEKKGKSPLAADPVLRNHLKPAALRCGITKQIGWHTFRRSFATLLKANGHDVKVTQELLRHSNSATTLDIYTQAVTEQKRQAQRSILGLLDSGATSGTNSPAKRQAQSGNWSLPHSEANELEPNGAELSKSTTATA
jgi:integrase